MAPQPEERILHYRILRHIDAGGMGEVFLAEDERLGRRVALKFLPRADAADPDRRERLRREARALASLSHPGIAGVYAIEEHGDRLFLVMEFIEGETLADRLARRPLPVHEVVERGRVLAEALAHAHARGVVHRDVKPSNILITPDGGTKLIDFGLAIHEGETRLTAEGSTAGTADHMSPEQTRGEEVDRRSDLFSLGVVLYEALTGVRPFARPTLEATFHAIRADEPEHPTGLRTGIPLELERIVMKLLRKNPDERYQHAEDLAADLLPLLSESTRTIVTGVPPTPTARSRRRLVLVLPALLLLVALAYLLNGLRLRQGGEAVAAQRSIAVISFQNMQDPADPHREAAMAASLLTVGLGQSQVIPVVGAQRVHDVLRQMGKADQAISSADALEVGKRTGATYIVTGYIYQTQPTVVLGAEVAATADGAVLTSRRVQAAGGEQAMFAAVDSLTIALRDGLAQAGFGVRGAPVDVAGQTTRNPVAYRAYAHGLDLLYRTEWAQAVESMRSAVVTDSTFAQAWYHLAVATWWTADFPAAGEAVERGLRLGSKLSERDRDGLRGLEMLVKGDWAKAEERYRRLVKRYPDDKEFYYGLGEALYHGGQDNDGAKAALERALQLDPQFGVALVHIIDVDVAHEDLAAALADAERSRRSDPSNPTWLAAKMTAFGELGYPDSALAVAREYLARSPQFWVLRQVGVIEIMSGRFDSAQVVVNAALRVAGPAMPELGTIAGSYIALAKGRWHEAERIANQGMARVTTQRIDPYMQFQGFRTKALLEMGRNDEAVASMLEAQNLPPRPNGSPAESYSDLVAVCLQGGHLRKAEEVLRKYDAVLKKKPAYWGTLDRNYAAAIVATAQGKPKEAIALLERSNPYALPNGFPTERDPLRRWALARALLAAGDHDRAIIELEKVAKRMVYAGNPTETFHAMTLLAKEYEARGRREDALALYRRVVYQYRFSEPGVRAKEEALAGITRLERAQARAAAN